MQFKSQKNNEQLLSFYIDRNGSIPLAVADSMHVPFPFPPPTRNNTDLFANVGEKEGDTELHERSLLHAGGKVRDVPDRLFSFVFFSGEYVFSGEKETKKGK